MMLFMGLGCVVGSHILYGITNIRYFKVLPLVSSPEEFFMLMEIIFGGGVFYGGLLGGLTASFIYIKVKKLALWDYADCGAACIPLFHSFARVGCFFAGCCYGKECSLGFASKANEFIPDVVGVTRFPVQLLEAFLNLMLSIAIFYMLKKGCAKGRLIFIYLSVYSIIRFNLEFLRGDAMRGIWFGVSTSQWVSIILLVLSTFALIMETKKKNRMIK